jgi:hypothetical protein
MTARRITGGWPPRDARWPRAGMMDRKGAVRIATGAHIAHGGCLRREYFGKDEDERDRSTLSDARADWHQASEQGFTFHGHRLSSLYRICDQSALTLMSGESLRASSF